MSLGFIFRQKSFEKLLSAVKENQKGLIVTGLPEASRPFLLAALLARIERPIVYVLPFSRDLADFKRSLSFYLRIMTPDLKAHLFPALGDNPYIELPPPLEVIAQRMKYFFTLQHRVPRLTLTNLLGLLKLLPAPHLLPDFFITLEKGQEYSRDNLLHLLSSWGYQRQDVVNSPGEFAWRGGVVDVFSPWQSFPFRLEFSGDEIVSLREFHPSTQRSVQRLEHIVLPSLNEYSRETQARESWVKAAHRFRQSKNIEDAEKKIRAVEEGSFFPSFNFLAVLDRTRFVSFRRYFQGALFILGGSQEMLTQWPQHLKFLEDEWRICQKEKRFSPPPGELFDLEGYSWLVNEACSWEEISSRTRQIIHFSFQSAPRFDNKIPFFLDYIKKKISAGERICLFLSNEALQKRLAKILQDHHLPSALRSNPLELVEKEGVYIYQGQIQRGFISPEDRLFVLAERDIFTEERVVRHRRRAQPFISHFQDLERGDYVVHADYGIGQFKGLIKMQVDRIYQDFLELEYKDGDKLYLPVEDLHLLQKYSPVGPTPPTLHKLGTPTWEKVKARTKKAIEQMARELVQLYAQRKALKGFRFSPSGEWEQEFARSFEYSETEDQLRAIREVLQDMESEAPMDRLLCGDVGYGKTEVALRACFKAVMDGKQVAVLCPTTVLASQHLETFRRRMALFPIRIEALTRFQSSAKQKAIIEDLKKGLVDVIIGTHRLLSDDVGFKDLGLLIIDEEQRFGVRHKEKIKQLKTTIDVLTMTATPIPRTLNLSLSGLRDISLIETPPRDRLAVHTVVAPFSRQLIESAIRKELAREGQVYFVHNRIEDIEEMARLIKKWVPQARVVIVHGQMKSSLLEKRMIEFIHHKHDVLVTTTIIENGLDIPLVNTLIVNRADRFGLAQLYQLRGRVGRSSRQAYAFFLIPPYSTLTSTAKERLQAIQEFTALGSGFRLAAKDLEIRGAGDFLGEKQHGYVEAVGFDFYLKLLEQTVRELKGEKLVEKPKCEVNLRVNLRIPESYLPQINLRLNLYKRISSIDSLRELEKIKEEISDRYGSPPPEVNNLLTLGAIKFLAQELFIQSLDRIGNRLVIKFYEQAVAHLPRLLKVMSQRKGYLTPQGIMSLPLSGKTEKSLLEETKLILMEFKRIYYNDEN
ncbi:MAG: transcription-repair coupling factor [Candidatus Aminicenantes bacterium]|nr:MAG: transcription-repair coupling factor [Candidatus Aminicenantes bacterium]